MFPAVVGGTGIWCTRVVGQCPFCCTTLPLCREGAVVQAGAQPVAFAGVPVVETGREPRCANERGSDIHHPPGDRTLRHPQHETDHRGAMRHQGTRGTYPRLPTNKNMPPAPIDNQNAILFADASVTASLTPAAVGAALKVQPDPAGWLRQHHLTGTTIFRASS